MFITKSRNDVSVVSWFVIFSLLLVGLLSPAVSFAGQTNSISQFGITWTFDKGYTFGQFANGDYWVIGPVTIIGINPPSVSGSRVKHGSMLNPSPTNDSQGYDSSMMHYDVNLNVALNVSSQNPLILQPGSSLVSVISIEAVDSRPQIRSGAVLTILSSAPPEGSFRPPYSGTDKSIKFNKSQLDYSLLAQLPRVGNTPRLKQQPGDSQSDSVERMFERPWIDHRVGWYGDWYHPLENMKHYGRDLSYQMGIGALMLHLNFTNAEKETLLIRFVQLGLDLYGIYEAGGTINWEPDGGISSGRKWPILFAGLILGDSDRSNIGFHSIDDPYFGEDSQTFYVEETSPGVYNYGYGGYSATDVGLPEWGIRHATYIQYDSKEWDSNYRRCCTAVSWAGFVLAARIMDVKELWNHDSLFDYQDRYMQTEPASEFRQWDDFTELMWDTYRPMFGPVWPSDSARPIANAGSDQTVTDADGNGSELVILDGSGSTDSDGTIISYVWTEGGNQIATGVNPEVGLSVGTHVITLKVTDDDDLTATDAVTITVNEKDTIGPSIVSVSAFINSVEILFDEALDQLSAEDVNNYSISNEILINSASLGTEPNKVILSTSEHSENLMYSLTVTNIYDTFNNVTPEATANYLYDYGLKAYFRFDEGSGLTTRDCSGTGNTGTLINEPNWTEGKFDGGISFESSDQAVEVGTTGINLAGGTVSLWVYPTAFPSVAQFFFSHVAEGWNNRVQIYTNTTEGGLGIGLGDTHGLDNNIYNLPLNTWCHIVLTWNGGEYVVYVDGAEQARGAYSGLSTLSSYADIGNTGNRSDRNEAFSGIIDEVRIYNRALSDSEVLDLFEDVPILLFYPIGDKQVDEGSTLTFTVNTTDPNTEVYIRDHNLPSEPNFIDKTFSWTAASGDVGSYEITFVAPYGQIEDLETITITVNSINGAPIIAPIGDKTVYENNLLKFSVSAVDPDGDEVICYADNMPSGAVFVNDTFLWTPGYDQAGTYIVSFVASDGKLEDIETTIITVNNVNRRPILAEIGDKLVNENQTLTFTVSATDPDGDELRYIAHNLPVGAVFSERTFSWAPDYEQAGSYQVSFVVTDGNNSADLEVITITVNNVNRTPALVTIGDKYVNVNETLSFAVSAVDPDGDIIICSVQNLPAGAVFSGGTFTWTPDSGQAGSYQVTFIASDGALQDSETITITADGVEPPPVDTNEGLIGYWKFDDGAGFTAQDSSGMNNTGTLINQPDWTAGKLDGGIDFVSAEQAVEVSTAGMNLGNGTISLWAYPTAFPATTQFLFGHVSNGWNNRIQIYTNNAGGGLGIGLGDTHRLNSDIYNLSLNAWAHIVLVWQDGGYVVYVNGIEQASGTYSGLSTLSSYADIGNTGNRNDRLEAFSGKIDDVRTYSRALTADEISELFNGANLPPVDVTEGLVAHWKLDDNAQDTTVVDGSDKGNHGTSQRDTSILSAVGVIDSALLFDGFSDYIGCGTFNPMLEGKVSFSAWIKFQARDSVYGGYIIAKGNDNSINSSYAMHLYSPDGSIENTGLYFMTGTSGGGIQWVASGTGAFQSDTWHHVAVTVNGNNVVLYIDGVKAKTGTFSGSIQDSSQSVWIGAQDRNNYRYCFKGFIDDVRIYNRVLTAEEVLRLYSLSSQ